MVSSTLVLDFLDCVPGEDPSTVSLLYRSRFSRSTVCSLLQFEPRAVLRSPVGSRVSSKRWNSGIIYFSLSDDLDSGNGSSVDGYVKKRFVLSYFFL